MKGLENMADIDAVCLAFYNTLLLPFFERVPEDHLLHVPVLAVDSMQQAENLT